MDPDGQLSQSEESELYAPLRARVQRSRVGLRAARGRRRHERHGLLRRRRCRGNDRPRRVRPDHRRRDDALRGGAAGRHDRARGGPRAAGKYVVEDEVTQTVPVKREEVRVEREPITDANVDAATDGPGDLRRRARGRPPRRGGRRRQAGRARGAGAPGQGDLHGGRAGLRRPSARSRSTSTTPVAAGADTDVHAGVALPLRPPACRRAAAARRGARRCYNLRRQHGDRDPHDHGYLDSRRRRCPPDRSMIAGNRSGVRRRCFPLFGVIAWLSRGRSPAPLPWGWTLGGMNPQCG